MISARFKTLDAVSTVFFVHIPKTGGTSFFDWLTRIFGPANCVQHAESLLIPEPTPETLRNLQDMRVVSGHVPIDYIAYFTSPQLQVVSIVRDPISQFFSNMNHLRRAEVTDDLLCSIKAKINVSIAHFLDTANSAELAFIENPQSNTIFGSLFAWRTASIDERMAFVKATYSAVLTTETMTAELAASFPANIIERRGDTRADVPYHNVGSYAREPLTDRHARLLVDIVSEDICLHRALLRHDADGEISDLLSRQASILHSAAS